MRRTRAERRKNNFKKAIRKRKMAREESTRHGYEDDIIEYYNNLNQYSKNKIHCSCHMCREKTRNKHGKFTPKFNPTISDKKKIDKFNYDVENYINTKISC